MGHTGMAGEVVVTGIGMMTPLGRSPGEVLRRIRRGETAATRLPFAVSAFSCPFYAPVTGFDAEQYFPENKTLRLMNRDAQMAAVAARLAMQDASVTADETYPADRIALYGATGMTSLSIEDVSRLIKSSAGRDGSLDLKRFGEVTLKRTRPVLSFKILANMPICFVSILQGIRGPNAIYTPWEGQGAQAIAAGICAIRRGAVPCAVVGGCDVKTRLMSSVALQQLGALESWSQHQKGCVPGEGAAFLVLEDGQQADKRSARVYARFRTYRIRSTTRNSIREDTFADVLSGLGVPDGAAMVSAADGDVLLADEEQQALQQTGLQPQLVLRPKPYLGNLFAAAATVQVGLGAELIGQKQGARSVMVNCFGFGREQGAFLLEAV